MPVDLRGCYLLTEAFESEGLLLEEESVDELGFAADDPSDLPRSPGDDFRA